MKTLVFLFATVAIGYSFDCIGRNNSCSESHMKCDTGYDPFCQHVPGPAGRFIGFCTCDKECKSASDCSNTGADGCPPKANATCDMKSGVCQCGKPKPPPHFHFQLHGNES